MQDMARAFRERHMETSLKKLRASPALIFLKVSWLFRTGKCVVGLMALLWLTAVAGMRRNHHPLGRFYVHGQGRKPGVVWCAHLT